MACHGYARTHARMHATCSHDFIIYLTACFMLFLMYYFPASKFTRCGGLIGEEEGTRGGAAHGY